MQIANDFWHNWTKSQQMQLLNTLPKEILMKLPNYISDDTFLSPLAFAEFLIENNKGTFEENFEELAVIVLETKDSFVLASLGQKFVDQIPEACVLYQSQSDWLLQENQIKYFGTGNGDEVTLKMSIYLPLLRDWKNMNFGTMLTTPSLKRWAFII
jgi:hypothetical protein